MPDESSDPASVTPSRKARLAAKLRENLRRRKTQARGLADNATDGAPIGDPGALSKPSGKS